MNDYSVIVNGTDISKLSGIDLYNHDFNQLPKREINSNKLARESLSIVTSAEYVSKDLSVVMEVCGGSRAGTELLVQQIKAICQPQNSEVRVRNAGELYKYTATLNEFTTEWDGITANVTILFYASTPIGMSVEQYTLFNMSGVTTSFASQTFTVLGSAEARPTVTVTLSALSGSGSFSITNGRTGQGITVTQAFSAGDIIEINSRDKKVTHNGSPIDFTGVFPVFPSGEQQVQYSDTFTTRNVTTTGTYNKRII